MKVIADTKKLSHEQWIALRRKGVGGSDAAAIVGLTPYMTPYKLWAEKTGRLPEQEDNEAMRQGRDLEEYVAKRFEEATGKKVKRQNKMLMHDDYDFILANTDRQVIGEDAGLECKTTSIMNLKKFKNGEYPDNYYVQCVHYMAVTGAKSWYLAVLVLNQGFYWFEIKRDEEEISALINAEVEFWNNHVVPDIAPPVDGYRPTSEAIDKVFRNAADDECQIIGLSNIENLLDLQKTKIALDKEIRRLQQEIKIELGECQTGYCDKYQITWKKINRATVSKELIRKVYPKIDLSKVSKSTSFRKFRIINTEEKGNAAN